MAEIKIEKKAAIWPWILAGLVILALLLYFLMFRNKTTDNAVMAGTTDSTGMAGNNLINVHENNSTVAAYIAFVNDTANNKMGLNHEFSSEALLKLTDATEAMAGEANYDVKADLERAKNASNSITKQPYETSHADSIKSASIILSNCLYNLQQSKYPSLNEAASDLKTAASQIDPATLTLDQKGAVKSFFHKAASLLGQMN